MKHDPAIEYVKAARAGNPFALADVARAVRDTIDAEGCGAFFAAWYELECQ